MDDLRFDKLVKSLSSVPDRRALLKRAGGLIGVAAATLIEAVPGLSEEADAKGGKSGKKAHKADKAGKGQKHAHKASKKGKKGHKGQNKTQPSGDFCGHSVGKNGGCKGACTAAGDGCGQSCEKDWCDDACPNKTGAEDRPCHCDKYCDPDCWVCTDKKAQFICDCNGCQPDCSGKECGSDGCSGNCGSCSDGKTCQDGKCVSTCVQQGGDCEHDSDCCDKLTCSSGTQSASGKKGRKPRGGTDKKTCQPVCEEKTPCSGPNDCCNGDNCCSGQCQHDACCIPVGSTGCSFSNDCCGDTSVCVKETGTCCEPNCDGKACGDNGCGGSCGDCDVCPGTCDSDADCPQPVNTETDGGAEVVCICNKNAGANKAGKGKPRGGGDKSGTCDSCTPESKDTTCNGKCGDQKNNCHQTVQCEPCQQCQGDCYTNKDCSGNSCVCSYGEVQPAWANPHGSCTPGQGCDGTCHNDNECGENCVCDQSGDHFQAGDGSTVYHCKPKQQCVPEGEPCEDNKDCCEGTCGEPDGNVTCEGGNCSPPPKVCKPPKQTCTAVPCYKDSFCQEKGGPDCVCNFSSHSDGKTKGGRKGTCGHREQCVPSGGSCLGGKLCCGGMTCQNGTCQGECVPKTCEQLGLNCGTVSDDCTGQLDCGTCTAPQTCGGGGTSNVCGCTPQCSGKTCGPDGCGGTCGPDCDEGFDCQGGGCICVPPTICSPVNGHCCTVADCCTLPHGKQRCQHNKCKIEGGKKHHHCDLGEENQCVDGEICVKVPKKHCDPHEKDCAHCKPESAVTNEEREMTRLALAERGITSAFFA